MNTQADRHFAALGGAHLVPSSISAQIRKLGELV